MDKGVTPLIENHPLVRGTFEVSYPVQVDYLDKVITINKLE